MHDLATFTMTDMAELGIALRGAGDGARNMEETASRLVRHLYDHLRDSQTGRPASALIRFYKTHRYGQLPADLRRFAQDTAENAPLSADSACLAMLATIGDKADWNARSRSKRHQAIPLLNTAMIEGAPMIARLVVQFGLDIQALLEPDPEFLKDLGQHSFNVFYVPRALGSPYIPAQQEFVIPEHIESVIGFGGMLPSASLFAVILFSRVPIPPATAEMFKTLALNVKLAVLPFDQAVFAQDSAVPEG